MIVSRTLLDMQVKCDHAPSSEYTWMPSEEAQPIQLLQGTLDLIVLRTLATMGPRHAYQIATRLQQVSDLIRDQTKVPISQVKVVEMSDDWSLGYELEI